jgi:hypothetical protein
MGKKGMIPSKEFSTSVAQWEEQAALSPSCHFHIPDAEISEQGEMILLMVGPNRNDSLTIVDHFSSAAEVISGEVSRTLYDFTVKFADHSPSLSDVVIAAPFDWPLRAKPWRRLEPSTFLNTVLWIDGYRQAEPQEKITKRINIAYSEGIFKFSSEHRIFGYLQLTLKLIEYSFPSAVAILVEKECDPESDDEWLLITATLSDNIETVLNQYDAYTRRFITSIPWPQRNKIRFNYDLP